MRGPQNMDIAMIDKVRSDFPILQNKIQLSSCSQSALHVNVKSAIERYMNTWEYDGMDWNLWMEVSENARKKFAKMINAKPSEIAIVSSVSHAISSILTSLPAVEDKTEILLSENEFPCVAHAALSQEGKVIKYVSPEIENYERTISRNTLLTSAPLVSYYNGEIYDVKKIAALAHLNGSLMFVDAYQGAGQLEIDVKELDVDFLATGTQKYLLGIPGIAFLYIKEEIAERLIPKVTGWFGQKNPFAFNIKEVEYASGALRFDTGTFPMLNGFAANSALDVLLDVGLKNIELYLRELSRFTIDYALGKGLEISSPLDPIRKGSNTAIKVKNAHLVEQELMKNGVVMSARADVIRIAPHFYNTEEDIARGIDMMVWVLKK